MRARCFVACSQAGSKACVPHSWLAWAEEHQGFRPVAHPGASTSLRRNCYCMADTPSPLTHRADGLAPTIDDPGHLLESSRNALRMLVRALRRAAKIVGHELWKGLESEGAWALAMDSAMTTRAEREQLNALAVEGSWLLGANSTTMLRVERDTQPPTRPALPRAERTLKRSPTPAFTHTALTPVIEPPDMPAAIGRLVYRGRSGAVVPFTAEMLGTGLMAAYPWSREHGWTATN